MVRLEDETLHAPLMKDGELTGLTSGGGDRKTPSSKEPSLRVLISAWLLLFIQYVVATFISSFFPDVASVLGICGSLSGAIMSAYPIGMTLTSSLAPVFILRVGTRTAAVLGLVSLALFVPLFGLVPDILPTSSSSGAFTVAFAICFFFSGLLGGFAETAAVVLVGDECSASLSKGLVMASVGTICGVGCMVGPAIGGALYDSLGFRGPFLVAGAVSMAVAGLVVWGFPQRKLKSGHGSTGGSSCLVQLRRVPRPLSFWATLSAVAMNGAVVATLDPTLEYRLTPAPLNFSPSGVGGAFAVSSALYVVSSILIGRLVDVHWRGIVAFKAVQSAGFVSLFLCFALLGPLETLPSSWAGALNSRDIVFVAMCLKGLGSAGTNAAYPDLVFGVAESDSELNALISGMWNAAYAFGWAAGPLLGGGLIDAFSVDSGDDDGDDDESSGFPRYATVVAFATAAYSVVFSLFALLSQRDEGQRDPKSVKTAEP